MKTLDLRQLTYRELEEKLGEAMAAERAEVERDFKSGFLLDAIAKKEKVAPTMAAPHVVSLSMGRRRAVSAMTTAMRIAISHEIVKDALRYGGSTASMAAVQIMSTPKNTIVVTARAP